MSGSIGGIDASIPLQAGKGVTAPNPLTQVGEFARAANALNQLKLFPGQLQQQGQQTQSQATALAQQQLRAATSVLTPLLTLPPGGITLDKVTSALASGERNLGIVTQPVLSHIIQSGIDPQSPAFDAFVRSQIASLSQGSGETALAAAVPHPGPMLDVGPTIQPTTVSPAGSVSPGVVTPVGPSYGKGLTPGEATAPTQIGVVPSGPGAGAPIMGTRQQFIESAGGLGTGRLPPALRNPAAPAPAPQGVIAGVGPAQEASLTTQGGASAKAFQDIAEHGVQARAQGAILDTMLGDTQQFVTGPGAGGIKSFRSVVQRISPSAAAAFGISPEAIAANESFDKFANQLADAQGAGSDARLAVNQGANPSSHLTPAGVDLIIRQLRGNADYLQARSRLAATYPDQTDRAGFESKIASHLDPRVFQYARMTGEQKANFYRSQADKSAFRKSWDWALTNGLVSNAAQ